MAIALGLDLTSHAGRQRLAVELARRPGGIAGRYFCTPHPPTIPLFPIVLSTFDPHVSIATKKIPNLKIHSFSEEEYSVWVPFLIGIFIIIGSTFVGFHIASSTGVKIFSSSSLGFFIGGGVVGIGFLAYSGYGYAQNKIMEVSEELEVQAKLYDDLRSELRNAYKKLKPSSIKADSQIFKKQLENLKRELEKIEKELTVQEGLKNKNINKIRRLEAQAQSLKREIKFKKKPFSSRKKMTALERRNYTLSEAESLKKTAGALIASLKIMNLHHHKREETLSRIKETYNSYSDACYLSYKANVDYLTCLNRVVEKQLEIAQCEKIYLEILSAANPFSIKWFALRKINKKISELSKYGKSEFYQDLIKTYKKLDRAMLKMMEAHEQLFQRRLDDQSQNFENQDVHEAYSAVTLQEANMALVELMHAKKLAKLLSITDPQQEKVIQKEVKVRRKIFKVKKALHHALNQTIADYQSMLHSHKKFSTFPITDRTTFDQAKKTLESKLAFAKSCENLIHAQSQYRSLPHHQQSFGPTPKLPPLVLVTEETLNRLLSLQKQLSTFFKDNQTIDPSKESLATEFRNLILAL